MDNKEYDKEKNIVEQWHDFYIFRCPHCNVYIIVHNSETNCKVFRCSTTLSPHASKEECDKTIKDNMGCTRPFIMSDDFKYIFKSDYI